MTILITSKAICYEKVYFDFKLLLPQLNTLSVFFIYL